MNLLLLLNKGCSDIQKTIFSCAMLSDNHTRRARYNQKRSILIGILLKLFAHRCKAPPSVTFFSLPLLTAIPPAATSCCEPIHELLVYLISVYMIRQAFAHNIFHHVVCCHVCTDSANKHEPSLIRSHR